MYSNKFKIQIVKEMNAKIMSIRKIAVKYNVSISSLYRWKNINPSTDILRNENYRKSLDGDIL